MKAITCFLLILLTGTATCQKPFEETIDTDSSTINIVRNSVYRIFTETYKRKDSVWCSISFVDDTTKINTEGWKLKNGRQIGTWKEYDINGNLLFTKNNEKHTCIVNPNMFPYHSLLEQMKLKADTLILNAYGKDFLTKHVVFDFDCYAYKKYKQVNQPDRDSSWTEDYVGSWTEPLAEKPNSFLFRYEVRLRDTDQQFIDLGICLDSNGVYMPSDDDFANNYGFELVKSSKKRFIIDKNTAITRAIKEGLKEKDSSKIDEFLFWENFKKLSFYNGQFRYYIAELTERKEYAVSEKRRGIVFRYLIYVFNPWTGEFIGKKKMKNIREWETFSGSSTGLIPDND